MFLLIWYQEQFQPVKYCLSSISTSRIIKLIKCKIQFLSLSCLLPLIFAFKTYASRKRFLLSAQDNFYIILSSYAEGHVKNNEVWISCLWLVSRCPKPGSFFGKFTVSQVLKSFSSRNNSPEPLAVGFSNS